MTRRPLRGNTSQDNKRPAGRKAFNKDLLSDIQHGGRTTLIGNRAYALCPFLPNLDKSSGSSLVKPRQNHRDARLDRSAKGASKHTLANGHISGPVNLSAISTKVERVLRGLMDLYTGWPASQQGSPDFLNR
jgi:hypothetical protein